MLKYLREVAILLVVTGYILSGVTLYDDIQTDRVQDLWKYVLFPLGMVAFLPLAPVFFLLRRRRFPTDRDRVLDFLDPPPEPSVQHPAGADRPTRRKRRKKRIQEDSPVDHPPAP